MAARDVFEVDLKRIKEHPAHEGIPDIGEEGFRSLVESIKLVGILEPVELLSAGDAEARREKKNAEKLLDGRQRVRAAKECGLEKVPAVYANLPEGISTSEYVYVKAAERRHLSKSQKAMLAVNLKQMIEKSGGQGKKTELLEKFPEAETSRDMAGQIFGVSGRYITTAEKVLEDEELAGKVRTGELSLSKAVRELNREAGRTEKRTDYDHSLTALKRFFSTWERIRASDAKLPKRGFDEITRLVQQLQEKLAQIGEGGDGGEGAD